jgi:arabinan endo-1,5-alpha-L-arabinosidase
MANPHMSTFRTALGLLLGAATAALSLHAQGTPTFTNVTVHDPSIVRDGSTYCVFGSHLASASTTDLMNWTQITRDWNAVSNPTCSLISGGSPQTQFAEAMSYTVPPAFWAPDVIKLGDGRYYFYYCVCNGTSRSALGLAVANSITGPYSNVGIMLESGMNGLSPDGTLYNNAVHPNVVDPSVFFDHTARLWMVYGSYSGGIFILSLDPSTGQPFAGQAYGKKLIGGNNSTIEGGYILYSPESAYYYLFFTFGGLDANGGYNIRMGRSRNPDGPYLDAAGNDLTNVKGAPNTVFDNASIVPYGVKLMGNWQFLHVASEPLTTSRGYVSPGGTSAYYDSATGKYLMVFHTRFVGTGEMHEVRVHQMFLNADGWLVVAPHRYAQETMTTTVASQIPGDFKLINHGKDITATVKTSSIITLNADGSISGSVTGTWQLSGDHYATLTLAGTSYRGVFARQWDDDNQVWTLTFSALSTDGVSVWGSKVAALTVDTAPAITTQPAGQTVTLGSSITFTVAASGSPTPTYQWRKDNVNLSGATGTSYTIASVAAGDAGSYTVVATNSAGSANSNAATLGVLASRLVDETVTTGHGVTLSAANASGSIQWQVSTDGGSTWSNLSNSGPYDGVTTSSLMITNAGSALNGLKYRFVATDNGSVSKSPAVTLTVAPASLPFPTSIAVDGSGNLFVGDANANTIQIISTTGLISLVAGTSGTSGTSDGTGAAARFNQPNGLTLLAGGTIMVSDTSNATIRSITSSGVVTTLAGSPGSRGNADGTGGAATFSSPIGIARDASGVLYVADAMNHTIRKITSNGIVSTIAGSAGVAGFTDGTGAAARFNFPSGIAVDGNGNIYVADTTNNLIRKITGADVVTTLAGVQNVAGYDDGTGSGALFNHPGGLAADGSGNLYLADTDNSTIRKITPAGVVTTIAGLPTIAGLENGAGQFALFNHPQALSVDASGNIYVADTGNATIRKIDANGNVNTLALTASIAPAFTTQPASQTVTVGTAVTFTVAASGLPAPTFQWQKGNVNISGAASASYSIASAAATDAGSYTAVATNASGSVTSNAATLTVNAAPTPTPAPSGGGGGGGAMEAWFIAGLTLLGAARWPVRKARRGTTHV